MGLSFQPINTVKRLSNHIPICRLVMNRPRTAVHNEHDIIISMGRSSITPHLAH